MLTIGSLYFKESEFKCKCGECGLGIMNMSDRLMIKLVAAREIADTPFIITSAMRCEKYNELVGGVRKSAHTRGYAVDIETLTHTRYRILTALLTVGFKRIGIYERFIHADIDPLKPKELIWYGK